MKRLLAPLLLLLPLLPASPARAADLLSLLAARDPAPLLEFLVALGARVDLSNPAQVRAAIGPTAGLPSRRTADGSFFGFTNPGGEVVWNGRAERNRIVLLVSPAFCVPDRMLVERLSGPEFPPPIRKSTVMLYLDTPFAGRPGTFFTRQYQSDCNGGFGLSQELRREPRR